MFLTPFNGYIVRSRLITVGSSDPESAYSTYTSPPNAMSKPLTATFHDFMSEGVVKYNQIYIKRNYRIELGKVFINRNRVSESLVKGLSKNRMQVADVIYTK